MSQKKTFRRQRTPESSFTKNDTVEIEILVKSRNGDIKIMHSVRIPCIPPARIRGKDL